MNKKIDVDIETTSGGVNGSVCPFYHHLRDPRTELILSNVFYEGSMRYSRDNWRGQKNEQCDEVTREIVETHINHALSHIYKYLGGSDIDLRNALCRVYMAISVLYQNGDKIPVVIVDEETKEKSWTEYEHGCQKWSNES